ncbi:MAG TPA: ATP-binding protein [Pirellulaceae bacterium]|nr:ATP-binding protein [Pirellulaceae bacterium]
MLTRIELTNFMAHAHTVIEPAAGLTVLVGPNNCGKSAVVAALQILCHNDPSTYVLRHGEKECSVQVTTDDGHTALWKRKKTGASYEIDGEKFDRLRGADVSEPLHRALRLPLVEGSGEADFDVHFGTQKSPIFLLNSSSATAARFFASSSDASRLVEMQSRHKARLAERQREKNRLEAESKQLTAELETLQPAVDLDKRLKAAEQQHAELLRRSGELEQAQRAAAALDAKQAEAAQVAALAASLEPLAPPPKLPPTQPLADLIDALQRAAAAHEQAAARAQQLAPLAAPPAMSDVAALARTADELAALDRAAARAEAERQRLSAICEPPRLADSAALAKLIENLFAAAAQAMRWESAASVAGIEAPRPQLELAPLRDFAGKFEAALALVAESAREEAAALAELNAAATELRAAADGEVCPTCGVPLDPERLLAHAATGNRNATEGVPYRGPR